MEKHPSIAVEHGLNAIASAATKESVSTLIDLLPVDLGRFGEFIDRPGFERIVAAHLIELTGESFGTDAIAWRNWLSAQPDERFSR